MNVIEQLAQSYPQLYLVPGPEGAQLYPEVVQKGRPAPDNSLSHFHTSPADEYRMAATPAGEVRVVTLGDREDFVTFLQIMANRCEPAEIPETQGAQFIDGIINRGRIEAHKAAFYRAAKEAGRPEPGFFEWVEELRRFTADKTNYTDAMLVLSVGPYSGVPAAELGCSEEEWQKLSHTIRFYHECTHFVCYRLCPVSCDPVRDELVADAVGIRAALGHFDRAAAELFLGIRSGRYVGGRLGNYTDDPAAMLPMIDAVFAVMEETVKTYASLPPLELAIRLQEAVANQ